MRCSGADCPDPPLSHPQTSSYYSHKLGNMSTSPEMEAQRRGVRSRGCQLNFDWMQIRNSIRRTARADSSAAVLNIMVREMASGHW